MLTWLLITMLLGGSSTPLLGYIADTQDNVKTVMARDQRQKKALDTLKAMKKSTKARNQQVKRTAKDLARAFDDHSVTAEQIDTIWTGYFATMDQHNHDMLDFRFKLKEDINRAEWEAIFPES